MNFTNKRKLIEQLQKAEKIAELEGRKYSIPENNITQRQKNATEKKERTLFAFTWLGKKPDLQLEFLHKQLIENSFISPDTLQDLVKGAFSGYKIIKPLNIKWIVKGKNKAVSKPSLFYFIDLLVRNQFIQVKSNSILYDKLKIIFVDHTGSPLKNLRQSNQSNLNRVNKPSEAEKLDQIVSSIPK